MGEKGARDAFYLCDQHLLSKNWLSLYDLFLYPPQTEKHAKERDCGFEQEH